MLFFDFGDFGSILQTWGVPKIIKNRQNRARGAFGARLGRLTEFGTDFEANWDEF